MAKIHFHILTILLLKYDIVIRIDSIAVPNSCFWFNTFSYAQSLDFYLTNQTIVLPGNQLM